MSCNACTKRYGFFCKETGCPNCGYSFCTKCLKKEIEVPKLSNKKLKVCPKCFEILAKIKEQNVVLQAEDSKLKLADSQIFTITEPFAAPILEPFHPAEEVLPDENNQSADVEIQQNLDIEITKRLAGLKTEMPTLTTDKEMAERLALIKDQEYKEYHNKDILISKDNRNDQEKIQDLLNQFVEENKIDENVNKSKIDPVTDIERRLAALRGNDINSKSLTFNTLKDESISVKKIVERYLDEAKLPEQYITEEEELISDLPKPSTNPELEELPFCIICNEDAVIRCLDCDNDLYCRNCFKEIHNDEEYRLHKTQNYAMPPPKFKENHFNFK